MEKIRHKFTFKDGREYEMLIVNTGEHVFTITKEKLWCNNNPYYEYSCGSYYLSSFDKNKAHEDYTLDYVLDIFLNGDEDDLWWSHD